MGRKDTIPEYDTIMTLAEVAAKVRCSETKIYKAVRYGHLEALPRTSTSQRLRFLNSEVTRWLKSGASSKRPANYRESEMPEHLRRYWDEKAKA